jgi:dipeptidyl aminopeptidase/acylaminoacyl peptidase
MRRFLLLISVLYFALPCFAQTKHPFTFEDMMALKRVEEPVPSPDGKWVLFAAVDVDLKANTKTPHVWVVPTAGGKEREIISDQDADRPRWAPDGKRFAYVSTKESGSQIWIAGFDGATGTVTGKHRLTNIATEASGELWSPDGKNILFKSDVYPECDGPPAEESACNAKKLDETKNFNVKAQIFTHLMYRHWNAYKEGKRTHLFVVPLIAPLPPGLPANTTLDYRTIVFGLDLTPGDYDAPPFSLGGQDNYAFSPDGQEICYSSNHDPVEAISTNKDLFTVPVNLPAKATSAQVLAQTRNITADNKAADETPLYSPDGNYIAYRAQTRPGDESDRWRLIFYDRKTAQKKGATEDWDRWVDGFAWSPDSQHIYANAEESGAAPLWRIDILGSYVADPKRLFRTGTNGDVAITPDGANLVFSRNTIQFPNQIFTARTAELPEKPGICGQKSRDVFIACPETAAVALTRLNNSVFSQISMSELDAFGFLGAKEETVQGFLVKPPNFDPSKKYPVKFLIHGGPEGAWGDDWSYRWNPELFAAPTPSGPEYVVIMINFHGSTGYGQKFIDAINGDWGGAPFEDLMKGLDYAEEHYPFIDKTRECALGASYGGYMANWILGHTDRCKCIVSHDGAFNTESAWGTTEELWFNEWEFKGMPWTNRELYRKWSPHLFATNFKTPTLVVHSQLDYRLDVSQGFDLFTTLQRLGVPSKMLYFPDEGHWVLKPQNSQLWYKTVNDWVDQWVGK